MFGVDLHIGVVVGRIEYDKHVFVILFYLDYVLGSQNIFGVQVMHPEFIDDTRDRLRISQTANLEPVDTISVDKFFERRFVCLDLPCVQSVGIVLCEADPGNGIMLAGIEISVGKMPVGNMLTLVWMYIFSSPHICLFLFEFYNRNTRTSELDMFVVILADARISVQVIAYQLPKYACSCPVQNTDASGTNLYGIVHKVSNGL